MSHVQHGRVFHVAGWPAVSRADDGSVSIPDGGPIAIVNQRPSGPMEFDDRLLLPAFPALVTAIRQSPSAGVVVSGRQVAEG